MLRKIEFLKRWGRVDQFFETRLPMRLPEGVRIFALRQENAFPRQSGFDAQRKGPGCGSATGLIAIEAENHPGGGPEHSFYQESGRAKYVSITDHEALEGFQLLAELEGIIPALETAHSIAYLLKVAPQMSSDQTIVLCLSGRGDKDVYTVADASGVKI